MREIKFRGKRIDNGKWVYGDLCQDKNIDMVSILKKSDKPYALGDSKKADTCFYFKLIQVDPETVGQFTTLKDDNGVDIFKGDLVKFNDRTIVYEVIWDPYRVAWWLKDVKADKRERDHDTDSQQLLNNSWQQRVVIGNIYDNHELI